jgi:hypothetical protein
VKNRALWGIFLAILSVTPAGAIPNLGSGAPGCMRMILERPMVESTAKKLTPECRDLRATYLGSLEVFAKNPAGFQKEIASAIESGSADDAYRAVLMAAIFDSTALIPALESRAKKESAKKPRYAFATAALARLKTGQCPPRYLSAPYDEVCRLSSPVARRLRELNPAR